MYLYLLDNAPCHRIKEIRELIESHGSVLLYLPAYSPDFNPIEEAFSKVKNYVKMNDIALHAMRDYRPLLVEACYQITDDDCYGYFKHVGYVE